MVEQFQTVVINARDHPVRSATVYVDRAEIFRSFKATLQPGSTNVHIKNVAGSVIPQSIRLDGIGVAIINEVKFESKPIKEGELDSVYTQDLVKQLKAFENELFKQRDMRSIIQTRIDTLDNAAKTIGQSSVSAGNKLAQFDEAAEAALDTYFDYHERKAIELLAKVRTINEKVTELEAEVSRARTEINQIRGYTNTTNNIILLLENLATEPIDVELDLSYQVYGVSWTPSYDVRVQCGTKGNIMMLTFNGNISQQTGEDWVDIDIVLSTGQPGFNGDLPKLGTTSVQFYRPPPAQPMGGGMACRTFMAADSMSNNMPMALESKQMKRLCTIPEENMLSTQFVVPTKKTIPSDQVDYKITVMTAELEALLHYHCVPKKNTNVFLTALVVNSTDFPLLPGPANVFINNCMSTNINLKFTPSGQKLECPLGVDKSIKVTYKPTNKYQSSVGVIAKSCSRTTEQRIIVHNMKRTGPIILTLHEPIPKSADEKIKVRLFQPEIKMPAPGANGQSVVEEDKTLKLPSVGAKIDDLHNLLWTESINSGEEREFVVKWTVEYPQNETLEYIEEGEY